MKTKKILTLFSICLLLYFPTKAATFTIQLGVAGGFTFTPSSIPNVILGDNINWVWVTGSHTSQSVTLPPGAAVWNNPMTSAASNFTYTPAVIGTYTYKCMPHNGLGMNGSFVVSMPLSLQLLNFDVKKISNENSDIELEWRTATECDNCSFIIEKSYDAVKFFEIFREKSLNLISQNKIYHYTDNEAKTSDKVIYYRLKEEDSFGRIYTLDSKKFSDYSSGSKELTISPNPTSNGLVNIKSSVFPIDRITICDLYGNQVFNVDFDQIDSEIILNIEELPKEIYILTVTTGSDQIIKRLVIE
jgi:plastocyanin